MLRTTRESNSTIILQVSQKSVSEHPLPRYLTVGALFDDNQANSYDNRTF